MLKKYLCGVLMYLNFFLCAQDQVKPNILKIELETNSFLNFENFQGQNVLANVGVNIKNNISLGLSTGMFYVQHKDNYVKKGKMKYIYYPINLFYQIKLGQKKHYLGVKLGIPFLSYFDSELVHAPNGFFNELWPTTSSIKSLDNVNPRNNLMLIISPYYKFYVRNRINGIVGMTTYICSGFFSHFNIGLSYTITTSKE